VRKNLWKKKQDSKKRVITLVVETTLGDHWMNTEDCKFSEIKGTDGYLVEKKEEK